MAGVCLGIGTLLWATGEPAGDVGLRPAASTTEGPGADPADRPALENPATGPAEPAPTATPGGATPAATAGVTPPVTAGVTPPPEAAPSLVVPVTVLNNSRHAGLAARAAERFEAAGWPVRETGNLTGRTPATTVYYPPGQEASAREFARRFHADARVLPRYDGLPGSGLTVVLTRDAAS